MQITIRQNNLFTQINHCQRIVEKRNTKPILSNILFEASDGQLKLTATDLQATLSSVTQADVSANGSFTLDAKKVFDIVKELAPEKPVLLKVDDNFVTIQNGKVKFRLATMDAAEFPNEPDDESDLYVDIKASELHRMISSTSFAMSTDETRKYLTGSLFDISQEHGLRIVATDGHRLALAEHSLPTHNGALSCIVPRKAVMEVKRLTESYDGMVRLGIGKRQVSVVLDSQRFTSKVIDAKYPAYDDVIPKDNLYQVTVDKKHLDQALRRCMVVANEFTHDVRLVFQGGVNDGCLLITAQNTADEQATEDISIEYQGTDIEIGFNAKYMRDVLAAIQTTTVRMMIKDSLSPVLFLEANHDMTRHVVMPMRI